MSTRTLEGVRLFSESYKNNHPDGVEKALMIFKEILLDPTISQTNVRRILDPLVSSNLRNDFNSLIKDIMDHFTYGRIDLDHYSKILLTKDSKGYLIPEITLVNGILSIVSAGHLSRGMDIAVEVSPNLNRLTGKELALWVYYLDPTTYAKTNGIGKSFDKFIREESVETAIYDFSCKFISPRPTRGMFFMNPMYVFKNQECIEDILPQVGDKISQQNLVVLSCGNIFEYCASTPDVLRFKEKLLGLANTETPFDALDCLHRYFPTEGYDLKIQKLGKKDRLTNFYDNSQNIHIEGLDERILKYLDGHKIDSSLSEDMEKWMVANLIGEEKESYQRICADLSRFMQKYTLYEVCLLCWKKITESEHRQELLKRLKEELAEMANTCFTGHITRLINIFSGYEEGVIKMSWLEQIKGNFTTLIAGKLKDSNLREIITEQLGEESMKKDDLLSLLIEVSGTLKPEYVGKGYLSEKDYENILDEIFSLYGV